MGKPYSLDLPERICADVAEGNSACSAGRLFGVCAATAVRLAAQHREHGTAVPKPQSRPAGQFGKLAPHRDFLLEIVQIDNGSSCDPRQQLSRSDAETGPAEPANA